MTCPICKRPVREPPPGQPLGTFPFCTERCKLVDLGRWMSGKYQVPINDPEESIDDNPNGVRRKSDDD